ncbi:sensor histidine kinase [Falsiroseomonas sp.]|uniref:sensor histidine kinase n=1 Tax=Falsiroseomonas sp. TaxID=2870721 RepID=UPI003F721211
MVRQDEQPSLLSTSPPSAAQKRLAGGVMALLLLGMALAAPHALIPLPGSEELLPAYAAALAVIELVTGALLLALFSVHRLLALMLLAAAYLFSGLMVLPWALTFPGVFEAIGVPPAGPQATATIAAARRLGFALLLLAYAVLACRKAPAVAPRHSGRVIAACILAVTVATAGLVVLILRHEPLLPRFMLEAGTISVNWTYFAILAAVIYAAAFVILLLRGWSVLDLWLTVVAFSLLIDISMLSFISGGMRLSLGWWAGRLYGLVAGMVVLFVLLAQTTALSAQLARMVAAERRVREARLLSLQALSASIAHEVNQPLASMVTNANAGLRWLLRDPPDHGETRAALERIGRDGLRAGRIIEGIRAIFRKGEQDRAALDLNRLLQEVLARCEAEARQHGVALQLRLDAGLPPVHGSAAQLEQVVAHLASNALEAMSQVTGRALLLRVTSRPGREGEVQVSFADTGPGVAEEQRRHIFEPFFTTKPEGTGMGLTYCQSILEAHGGRLWVEDNAPDGAIFHFTLPIHAPTAGRAWTQGSAA